MLHARKVAKAIVRTRAWTYVLQTIMLHQDIWLVLSEYCLARLYKSRLEILIQTVLGEVSNRSEWILLLGGDFEPLFPGDAEVVGCFIHGVHHHFADVVVLLVRPWSRHSAALFKGQLLLRKPLRNCVAFLLTEWVFQAVLSRTWVGDVTLV